MKPTCYVDGCTRKSRTLGLCNTHYQRHHRTGRFELKFSTRQERFMAKVMIDPESGCWLWLAERALACGLPYGRFYSTRNEGAHRAAYEMFKGPIPDGAVIDHLCSNTSCVNPDHLEAVTQKENCQRTVARGRGRWAGYQKQTCSIDECARIAASRGLCSHHYLKAYKAGTLVVKKRDKRPALVNVFEMTEEVS